MRILDNFEILVGKPLDSRFSVGTKQELDNLRRSIYSYPYMKVVNLADGKTYELNGDKSAWVLFESKGEKGDPGESGKSPTVGTVELRTGDLNLEITMGSNMKMNFILTLPDIGSLERTDLNTQSNTIVGAINELYNKIKSL